MSSSGYAIVQTLVNRAGNTEQGLDPGAVGAAPPLAYYRVRARNAGGDSGDAPPG